MSDFIKRGHIAAALVIVMLLAGCGEGNVTGREEDKSSDAGTYNSTDDAVGAEKDGDAHNVSGGAINIESEAYDAFAAQIDAMTTPYLSEDTASVLPDALANGNNEEKAAFALDLADDMALAQFYDVATDEMMVISGEAVKAYPHPLLLNNYAAMLTGRGAYDEALVLFNDALMQEPENPVLLVNAANVYLQKEDFTTAGQYANKALAASEDFGPAYQVLTTVHLHNGDSVLAAETMVKSAKHCFNDITIYHFESFLSAVSYLDPLKDEYPLKEEFIDILYDIAKENVDTSDVNQEVDTPESQITIKPFPQVSSPDNLMNSYKYLQEESDKINAKNQEADSASYDYKDLIDDYLQQSSYPDDGSYPVIKNVRQIYAFMVLQSYYDFELEKCKRELLDYESTSFEERGQEVSKMEDEYDKLIEEARNKTEAQGDKLWAGIFNTINGQPIPDEDLAKLWEAGLVEPRLEVEEARKALEIYKRYAQDAIAKAEENYNEIKQLLEEYWLKTGGLLKYFTDENVFNKFAIDREITVYSSLSNPIYFLKDQSLDLISANADLNNAELEYNVLASAASENLKLIEPEKKEEKHEGEDVVPDYEKEAFTVYPEAGDLGDIGLETGLFGFNAATQFNGEDIKLNADSPFGSIGGSKNIYDGSSDAYAVHGVKAEGNTDWFMDTKTVEKILAKGGKLGAAVGRIGKIGFGLSDSNLKGKYCQMDSSHHIIDIGLVYSREKGTEVAGIGRSEKVEVRKSLMTGVAIKTTTVKYKFLFATHESRKN